MCVDMGPITAGTNGAAASSDGDRKSCGGCARIIHGSLAQPGNTKAQQLLKTLIQSKQKVSLASKLNFVMINFMVVTCTEC